MTVFVRQVSRAHQFDSRNGTVAAACRGCHRDIADTIEARPRGG